jgi:FecR protein
MRDNTPKTMWARGEAGDTDKRQAVHTAELIVLTMASLLLWSVIALAQQQEPIGQVTVLQGQATVQHAGSTQAVPLSSQQPVYREDIIQTLEASKIKLVLLDGTELTLGERGTMTLSKFVYAPQHKMHQGIVSIASGFFRAVARKVLQQTLFEMRTDTAVAAVRGTQWLCEVTPGSDGYCRITRGGCRRAHAQEYPRQGRVDTRARDRRTREPPSYSTQKMG